MIATALRRILPVAAPMEAQWFVEGERCVLRITRGKKTEAFEMPPEIAIAICNVGVEAARSAQDAVNKRKLAAR